MPDPQDPGTFERSRLDWDERGQGVHAEVLGWYRELLALRARVPALRDGRFAGVEVAHGERWLELRRGGGAVTLVANLGEAVVERPRPPGSLVLTSVSGVEERGERVVVPGACAVVYLRE